MAAPSVVERQLMFRVDDADRTYARVALECDDAVAGRRQFRRTSTGWALTVPRPDLCRLEYRLLLTAPDGSVHVVCDPGNPERVRTAFGERSVALLPGYRPPEWLRREAPPGSTTVLGHLDQKVGFLPIDVWSPAGMADDDPGPLLLVHDGPEYADLAGLTAYAATMVADGVLPAFRLALMRPVEREEWYSANPDYLSAELDALDSVAGTVAVRGDPVAMGASLGGLSALLLALGGASRFAGVFSQSGSFFEAELDAQESLYPHFGRIVYAVGAVSASPPAARPLAVALTCGLHEENYDNNRAMAAILDRLGHRVGLTAAPDLHNYTAWRDSLHPGLTDLLQSVWSTPG